ncbi:MAG: pre-16S rRNA-processing nuclease YqgF [Candidatus Eremiobacterota bacterium]
MTVLAVDPGRRKCGLAVVSDQGVVERTIVPTEDLEGTVRGLLGRHSPGAVVVGGSTGSREVVSRLNKILTQTPRVVDERHTTERARRRYFRDHPPRGFWRLVPLGLQVPPVPYDDYAAVVMAEEFLAGQCGQT